MDVPRKTRYALRAIFELAKHYGQGPVKIGDIAAAQATPPRFLEVILSQLKQAGFVDSRRGKHGGYFLIRSPEKLSVGDVVRFLQGSIRLVGCSAAGPVDDCPLYENCVFLAMWDKAQKAISDVYDGTSFQDLVDQYEQLRDQHIPTYTI